MGEGYRIIAASRGVRANEKQDITRSSPSHDSLCWDAVGENASPDRVGVAFYGLQTTRLCVALSRYAGEEHTGRGGHRVYTYNVIFDAGDFALCGFNPFIVLRAMMNADLARPQLKPPQALPELRLELGDGEAQVANAHTAIAAPVQQYAADGAGFWAALSAPWRACVLQAVFDERSVVINLDDGWLERAEAILMGVPGPMRAAISFSAGLRFSIGRARRVSIVHDEQGVAKARNAGHNVEFIDPGSADVAPDVPASPWLSFVERHWSQADIAKLSQRTSKAFSDVAPDARDRIARLYDKIDSLSDENTEALIDSAVAHMGEPDRGAETEIATELVDTARQILTRRFEQMTWSEAKRFWPAICTMPQASPDALRFVQPLIEAALQSAMREHPAVAAEAALDLSECPRGAGNGNGDTSKEHSGYNIVEDVLEEFAKWVGGAATEELERTPGTNKSLDALVAQWSRLRPDCPTVERMRQRLSPMPSV